MTFEEARQNLKDAREAIDQAFDGSFPDYKTLRPLTNALAQAEKDYKDAAVKHLAEGRDKLRA